MSELVSIIVPCYNEQECLVELHRRLSETVTSLHYRFEIILVDDGSMDQTWAVIQDLARKDPRVRGLRLSRNFGHQAALRAGYDAAAGSAVICLDSDMQHPPELIPRLLECWKEGHQVVNTVRSDTQSVGLWKRLSSVVFYRVFALLSGMPFRTGLADFRLVDRSVVRCLRSMPERNLSFRFATQWMGFSHAYVDYECGERFAGQSKYTLPKMTRLALRSVVQFSTVPLRISFWLSLAGALACVGYAGYALFVRFVLGSAVPGWTSVILVVSFWASLQFLAIGLLGEYVAVIYDEAKRRPRYLISDMTQKQPAD